MEENNVIETTAEVLGAEPDLEINTEETAVDTSNEMEDVLVMDTKDLAIKAGIAAVGGITIGIVVKKVISPALKKLGKKVKAKIHAATAPKDEYEDDAVNITAEDMEIIQNCALSKTMNVEENNEE